MSRLSNLSSGLIGTVVGAIIGIGGTLFALYITLYLDFAVDVAAAKKELENANQIINNYKSDSIGPRYKLLNTEIEWKTVLIDVDEEKFSEMYYQLVKLDLLRDLIINTTQEENKTKLIEEYNNDIRSIRGNVDFEEQIKQLDRVNNRRFE